MSAAELQQQYTRASTQIQALLNNDLKAICKSEALLISGVKSVLQNRIRSRMQDLVDTGDAAGLTRLTNTIAAHAPPHTQTPKTPMKGSGYTNSTPLPAYNTDYRPSPYRPNSVSQNLGQRQTIEYKQSVFYDIRQTLVRQTELPAVGQHRNVVNTEIRLDANVVPQIQRSTSMRVMLFCCADSGYLSHTQRQDISFPNQIEVRANGHHFQGNLRGLKKKAGTTSPADITDFLTKSATAPNPLSITYAATDKKYFFTVYLVRKYSVDELVQKIGSRTIKKASVIDEMLTNGKDAEIEATSFMMSLKCPISTMRMALPCRSTACVHNRCFDASSFLQAQMQAPQWSCPICYTVFDFNALAVDEYVQDILRQTSSSTEQVMIEPDGTWKRDNQLNGVQNSKRKASAAFGNDDDDDDVILVKGGANGFGTPSSRTDSPGGVRLPLQPDASGTPSRSKQTPSSKKAEPEVIVISSDDEDEAPIAPIKRQKTFPGVGSGSGSQYPPLPRENLSTSVPRRPADINIQDTHVRHNPPLYAQPRYYPTQSSSYNEPWSPFANNGGFSDAFGQPPNQQSPGYNNYAQQRPSGGHGGASHYTPQGFGSRYQ